MAAHFPPLLVPVLRKLFGEAACDYPLEHGRVASPITFEHYFSGDHAEMVRLLRRLRAEPEEVAREICRSDRPRAIADALRNEENSFSTVQRVVILETVAFERRPCPARTDPLAELAVAWSKRAQSEPSGGARSLQVMFWLRAASEIFEPRPREPFVPHGPWEDLANAVAETLTAWRRWLPNPSPMGLEELNLLRLRACDPNYFRSAGQCFVQAIADEKEVTRKWGLSNLGGAKHDADSR